MTRVLATATMAFFLLPLLRQTLVNFARRAWSFLMAAQEFSMRVERMNPCPRPVIFPRRSVSPVECSREVSPAKAAIFFPLVKREKSSPNSRTKRMAVFYPMPGRLSAMAKAFR